MHDEYQVPAAGIAQNIAPDFQIFDTRNAGSQGEHSSTELSDMLIRDAFLVSDQNIMLQHYRTFTPAGMMEAAVLSFSAAKPAAVLYRRMNSSRSALGMISSMLSNTPPQRSSSRFSKPNGPAPRLRKTSCDISAH